MILDEPLIPAKTVREVLKDATMNDWNLLKEMTELKPGDRVSYLHKVERSVLLEYDEVQLWLNEQTRSPVLPKSEPEPLPRRGVHLHLLTFIIMVVLIVGLLLEVNLK